MTIRVATLMPNTGIPTANRAASSSANSTRRLALVSTVRATPCWAAMTMSGVTVSAGITLAKKRCRHGIQKPETQPTRSNNTIARTDATAGAAIAAIAM